MPIKDQLKKLESNWLLGAASVRPARPAMPRAGSRPPCPRACRRPLPRLVVCFPGNLRVRIRLVGRVDDAAKLLRSLGQVPRIDKLVTSLNRAAEAALPLGKGLLVQAVQAVTVTAARSILGGGGAARGSCSHGWAPSSWSSEARG